MSLEHDILKLLHLHELKQQAEADAAPAPSPPADPEVTARRFLAQAEQFALRAGIDVDAIKNRMPDATTQELAHELRKMYIEYLELHGLTHLGLGQQPAERTVEPLGPLIKAAAEAAAASPPQPEPVDDVVVPPGSTRSAVLRAQAGPVEWPCERDRIRIEEGQRALRKANRWKLYDPEQFE